MINSLLLILVLILTSAFFAISEIALAASRKIKLKQLADEGNNNAKQILQLLENPGLFFTVIQIGINAVVILGGIFGDYAFSPFFTPIFAKILPNEFVESASFISSFLLVTSLFIVFADLIPKRIGMIAPETIALRIVNPMRLCLTIFRPFVWLFNGIANIVFKIFNLPHTRNDDITSDDIYAVVQAGASAGVLRKQEHEFIENIFDLDFRTATSAMTARESVIYLDKQDSEESIIEKITQFPHSKFLVCDGTIDQVVGYVGSKALLKKVLAGEALILSQDLNIQSVSTIPDTLTLSETLESFKISRDDFAVIINEYALVVGIITLKDVMLTLMGDFLPNSEEDQIVAQDNNSWLVDGVTPVEDVCRAIEIENFPEEENYETIGGFMMYTLRRIPKRKDYVKYAGYRFEVININNYKIEEVLITRIDKQILETPPVQLSDETTTI